jgi:hypothetical protein
MKLIISIVLISMISIASFAQNDSLPYSFFIAGHTYGKPGVNNIGLHPPFKEKFSYIQSRPEIKFGVLTGDIVSANPTSQDWDEVDNDIISLGLPVYFAVGNHDMEDRALYESRYDSTYYYFKYQKDLFIVLDPNIDGWSISGDQLNFVRKTVDSLAPSCDNIYVFFHQILWKEGGTKFDYIHWNSDEGKGAHVNFWPEVMPIFMHLTNKVFMFAGDLGSSWSSDVTYDTYNNISLISSGMGDEDGENFIIINVDSNKTTSYDLICLSNDNPNCLGHLENHLTIDILNKPLSYRTYPNPAEKFTTISLDASVENHIELYNFQGALIQEKIITAEPYYTMNIEAFRNGLYFLRVTTIFGQQTIKLVIE